MSNKFLIVAVFLSNEVPLTFSKGMEAEDEDDGNFKIEECREDIINSLFPQASDHFQVPLTRENLWELFVFESSWDPRTQEGDPPVQVAHWNRFQILTGEQDNS